MNLYLRKVVHSEARDNLYEALQVKSFFSRTTFLSASFRSKTGSRERKSALMARQAALLGRAERSTTGARRVAPEGARG